MDDCVRIPSSLIADMNEVDYKTMNQSQHGGGNNITVQGVRGMPMMNPYHIGYQQTQLNNGNPPMLIHTVPSYVSTRSISNRSVGRSVSGRSVATASTRFGSRTDVTHDAERIATATAQARAAAQSILLTGGSQASALSTARAAAQSALIQSYHDGPSTSLMRFRGSKPPLGSSNQKNKTFRNRRKDRQQAEIIASMALVSANEALGGAGMMGHNDMMSMAMSPSSQYYNDTNSEFPDEHTNYRSIAPYKMGAYGRSQSIQSYNDLQLQNQQGEYPRNPQDNPNKSNPPMILGPAGALQSLTAPTKTSMIQDQESTKNSSSSKKKVISGSVQTEQQPTITSDAMMMLTKNPSIRDFFRSSKNETSTNRETENDVEAPSKLPKSKIPSEMPMPISIKNVASIRGSNSGGNKQNGKVVNTRQQTGTPRSRQRQLSGSQISCYSDASSYVSNSYTAGSTTYYDEQTADYTKETYESTGMKTKNVRKSSNNTVGGGSLGNNTFFSQFDPFVTTFSEVFACNPGPARHIEKYSQSKNSITRHLKQRESRDASINGSSFDNNFRERNNLNVRKEDERDPPPEQQQKEASPKNVLVVGNNKSTTKPVTSVEGSFSSGSDSLVERTINTNPKNEKSKQNYRDLSAKPQKKKVTSPTMEQLVLRALSAISPKNGGANSKRPRLNIIPLKQNAGPGVTNNTYRTANDANAVNNPNARTSKKNASKPSTMEAVDTANRAGGPQQRHGFEWNTSSSGSNDQPHMAGSDGSNAYRYNSHSDSDVSAQQYNNSTANMPTTAAPSNMNLTPLPVYSESPAATQRGKRLGSLFQRSNK